MSSDNLNPNPPWDDPRITAYVMDELFGEEKTSFEAEMKANESLADAVEQARQVTAKLSGFYASIPNEQLDAGRREKLSDHSEPVSKSKNWPLTVVKFVVAASVLFVLAALMLPIRNASMQVAQTDSVAFERDFEPPTGEATLGENAPIDELRYAGNESMMREEIAEAEAPSDSAMPAPTAIPEPRSRPASKPAKVSEPSEGMELADKERAKSGYVQDAAAAPGQSTRELKKMASGLNEKAKEAPASTLQASGGQYSSTGSPSGSVLRRSNARQELQMPIADQIKPMRGPALPGPAMEGVGGGMGGQGPGMGGDKYDLIVENTFKRVAEHPLSTLSIDVDTASYSKVRMSLRGNRLPRPDAVRIEEMLNYFEYDYAAPLEPTKDPTSTPDPFVAGMAVADCPWQPEHRLVRVGLQAVELEKQERPQCNLVFLIDTSGSMRASNKLPLVIDGMKLLLDELRPDDTVAIVVYAGSAGLVLDSTPVKKKKKIIKSLSQLQSGGSTNGGAGLRLAYETARENFAKDGVNRVILCSDGDFNVGMTGTDELVREAKSQAKSGVDLTVLGFGMGNHNDAMMEQISNDAEGNYGFIDTIAEAKKVLADQLTGTLVTVAKDVKIQIEFNPAVVSSYRLIGYENRVLAKEDFNDDKKDAGEIGAGHRVTALYEVVPAGKLPATIKPAVDPLKYQANAADPVSEEEAADADTDIAKKDSVEQPSVDPNAEMLTLKLRYKPPQGNKSTLMTRVLKDEGQTFADADADFRFAAAVAGFGMQLRNSEHVGNWTYDDVIEVARSAKGDDPHGLRSEMVELAETARNLTIND